MSITKRETCSYVLKFYVLFGSSPQMSQLRCENRDKNDICFKKFTRIRRLRNLRFKYSRNVENILFSFSLDKDYEIESIEKSLKKLELSEKIMKIKDSTTVYSILDKPV
jgi:hypothetical protein